MKVLLLGGTGVMGNYLVELLNEDHIDTTVTSRRTHKNFGSIRYVVGNAKDDNFLKSITDNQKWNVIVDFMSYETNEFIRRVDILCSSTDQYFFMSTARVYGNEEYPIKESSPKLLDSSKDEEFLATNEYALTKAKQENYLRNSKWKNYTIIRPCITYGDERLQLGVLEKEEWLYRALHGRTIIFDEKIAPRITTMTNGLDVAKTIYSLIGNAKAYGISIHITCNYHRTWNQIWDIYRSAFKEIIGKDPRISFVSTEQFLKTRSPNLKYQVIYDRHYDKDTILRLKSISWILLILLHQKRA